MTYTEIKDLAASIAKSKLYGIETPEQAIVLMHLCRSKGLDPIQAVERYHIIESKPSMRADAMQAEFQRQGGKIIWQQTDSKVCTAVFYHPVHAPDGCTMTVTFQELDDAGVTKGKYGIKDNWRKFPRQMLRARVISEGVRAILPSVVVGLYTPEEVQDFTIIEHPVPAPALPPPPPPAIEHTPPPPTEPGNGSNGDNKAKLQTLRERFSEYSAKHGLDKSMKVVQAITGPLTKKSADIPPKFYDAVIAALTIETAQPEAQS